MRPSKKRAATTSQIFGFSEENVAIRTQWRFLIGAVIWFVLSSITILLTISTAGQPNRVTIIFMGLLKYVPLLLVIYSLAKQKAAQYLEDIFELNDESAAIDFIEEVAFGYGHEYITINEGKISKEDELSPIILIGGPGQIQVNLGSAALLERLDGTPEVIYARSEPWHLGRFERIREIGKHDEVGKREYAVINLRSQFSENLSVKARTKDGIPIEALDVKVIFSILRSDEDTRENTSYSFNEHALQTLVYNQITITPPSSASGVTFPWDTTVIPLVKNEMERMISSHTLSDLLSNMSQKELDTITKNEETVAQMRVEVTGAHIIGQHAKKAQQVVKEQQPNITTQFLDDAFQQKAAELGVAVEWIDIGKWQVTSPIIDKKLKDGWSLIRENAKRQNNIGRLSKKHQMDELIELIKNVVIVSYEKNTLLRPFRFTNRNRENFPRELQNLIDEDPDNMASYLDRDLDLEIPDKKDPSKIAREILSKFRVELIAALDLIQKEAKPENEIQQEIEKIDLALRYIAKHLPY